MVLAPREYRIIIETQTEATSVRLPRKVKGFFVRFARESYRKFPWRNERVDPFGLLIAEILLKRTRAEDVVPAWVDLMDRYPNPEKLALARRATLEELLGQLGLQRQRAIALKELAQGLVEKHNSKVPSDLQSLIELPHVGMYTACAISCFKFGKRYPIVDANLLRVFKRLIGQSFGQDVRRTREAWTMAWSILPKRNVQKHNYGMLDFAALVCKPRRPECMACSLRTECCFALARGKGG